VRWKKHAKLDYLGLAEKVKIFAVIRSLTPSGLLASHYRSPGCTRSYSNLIPSGLYKIEPFNPEGIKFE
jgi:hypothetical protein